MRDMLKKRLHDANRKRLRSKKIQEKKLARGSADCGYRAHGEVLEFDHLRDKKFEISSGRGDSWVAVLEEMAKCDVVCANCHRVRTVNRRAQRLGGSPPPTELTEK